MKMLNRIIGLISDLVLIANVVFCDVDIFIYHF